MQVKVSVIGPVALAVGILVGGALGYSLASNGGSASSSPPPTASPSAYGDATSTAGAAPGAAASPVAASSSARGSSPGSATPEVGSGILSGTVRTKDGKLVEGVLVRATPVIEWKPPEDPNAEAPPGSPPSPEFEELMRRASEEYALRRAAGRRESVTDSQGRYAIDGLPAQKYYVEAWRAHYRLEKVGSDDWKPLSVGKVCHFLAIPVRSVRVSVLLPDGGVPENATISWTASAGGASGSSTWRKEDPRIDMDFGTFEFTASVEPHSDQEYSGFRRLRYRPRRSPAEFAAYESDSQSVTIGEGDLPELTFQLRSRPGLHVKVLYPTEERPRTVRIAAMRLEPGQPVEPSHLLRSEGVQWTWLEDGTEGSLQDLAPGTYLVGATFRGGRVGPTATVAVGDTFATVELRVAPGDPGDRVKVWVRAPDGTPVPDVNLQVGCRCGDEESSSSADLESEADGSFRVEHHPGPDDDEDEGPPAWYVKAVSSRFGVAETTYDPARDREITVAFATPAVLRVVVAGWAENPDRERTNLMLESVPDPGHPGQDNEYASLGTTGTATFPPCRPGKYALVLNLGPKTEGRSNRRRSWGGTEVSRTPLSLSAGETTVTVALVALSELVVHFKGEAPDLYSVEPDGSPGDYATSGEADGNGILRFPDLKPGRYRLSTRDGDMWVDVPASGPVTFRANPFNSYRLLVTEGGYLHGLGLKTGDLVVAVNGVEFKDRPTMDAALLISLTRESSTFTVLRDGQKFDVSGDVRKLQEDGGSDVQPWAR